MKYNYLTDIQNLTIFILNFIIEFPDLVADFVLYCYYYLYSAYTHNKTTSHTPNTEKI